MPRKSKRQNNLEKQIQEAIEKKLDHEIEVKYGMKDDNDKILTKNIISGNVAGNPNFFRMMPNIHQSGNVPAGTAEVGQYNQRIGNEIVLKKIKIHGNISFNSAVISQVNFENAKLAVRVMILRAKNISDVQELFAQMPTDTLLRFGSDNSNGVATYGGFTMDSFRDINRNTFAVRYDKVHYLNAPVLLPGTTGPDISLVPSGLRIIKEELTFGKNGLKLKFEENSDLQPNNMPYFMVIGYSSMSSTNQPNDNLVRASFSFVSEYTDA